MEQNQEKFDELYDSFNKEFPIEKLSELQLEKYTNLTKDSFCYWIETKTNDLGDIHGSTSSKFGIYQFNKTPTDTKCLHDDKYAWLKKYGNTSKSAYDNILPNIVSIAKYARSGEFEKTDDIDISEMFKWKIAFLYSERKLINWFSKELLIEFVKHFGESVDEKTPTSKLQKILINKKGSKSLMEFDNILTPIWEKLKNNNSTATEITSTQNGDQKMSTTSNSLTSKLKDLLLHTHNLILHGAPGTGKTHLTHEIAKAMNAETSFVQFHPSYDYTDFVEGLRPVKSSDGTSSIGFERKDGVFKEFCKRALKNLIDSKKSVEDLQKEISTDEQIENFLEKAIDDETEFEIAHGNKFKIEDSSDKSILISIPANKITNELSLPKNDLVQLLNSDTKIESGADIKSFFNRKWRTQQDSYILTLYNEIKSQKQKQTQPAQNVQKIEKKNFLFIIDEINRGELSKIFGELFYAIEPGYRGEKGRIQTQYQNLVEEGDVFKDGFYIPENVYIIGTMNDIDRSVDTMDFAFRRRFTFYEVKAEDTVEMLDEKTDENGNTTGLSAKIADEAKNRMTNLNNAISAIEGLNSSYHIGGAYFLKLNDFSGSTEEKFAQLWNYHLEGLLREYLRGRDDAEEKLAELKEAVVELVETTSQSDEVNHSEQSEESADE